MSNQSNTDETVVYTNNASLVKSVYSIPTDDILAQIVTIKRFGVLTICEVVILEGSESSIYD